MFIFSRRPEICRIYAKEHWSSAGRLWCPKILFRQCLLVFQPYLSIFKEAGARAYVDFNMKVLPCSCCGSIYDLSLQEMIISCCLANTTTTHKHTQTNTHPHTERLFPGTFPCSFYPGSCILISIPKNLLFQKGFLRDTVSYKATIMCNQYWDHGIGITLQFILFALLTTV